MTVARPLPGIRFEAQARPLGDVLPRMDIPVFAGFAASGPLHLPVAVEDVAQLAMIFGGDVELPRPAKSREPRFAQLASAVRAFFRNGGKRCWVIRVADRATAVSNSFAVPGLVASGTLAPAIAWARSEGSWSDAVRVRTNLVPAPLAFESFDGARLRVRIASSRDVAVGDLLRVNGATYLFADTVTIDGRIATVEGALWSASPPLSSPPAFESAVERLTFDLTAQSETETFRLTGLGFAPAHPRYFGALPLDAALFDERTAWLQPAPPVGGGDWTNLWRDAATPRFPLASGDNTTRFLPIGMTALLSTPAGPLPVTGTELERDGLAVFSADLFIDPNLRETQVRDVLDLADALRYEAGLQLTGIHAALGIEEVTMLSAPDAVHRGWIPDAVGGLTSPLHDGSSEGGSSEFLGVPRSSSEKAELLDPRGTPRNRGTEEPSFVACSSLDPIAVPLLGATDVDGGTYALTWNTLAGTTDELQEATQPDFSDAATIFAGTTGRLDFIARPSGDYYYRVRRLRDGRTSAWSNGVGVRVAGTSGFVALDDDDTDDPHLVTIHEAMLRMCAARADLVALLSLPRHYDERRAVTHTTTLMTALEPQALSYGGLWHPWLIGRDDDAGPLRATTPDGATAGVMAARALARGAWVAPANEPLTGVLALTPEIPAHARQSLQDAAVNLIRREPAGFLCLDADTLSSDEEVRPLNVRRLLILVRRCALRTGNDYAFEPHSMNLRNTIKRGFESMLSSMFLRGAFAGRNEKSAFQVVTDETVNTPQSTDNGRFIAELKIAPSRPLSFLTVRLVQRGEAATAEEVR
ncbi:MAG TPA: hypothetical protein VF432_09390 [Thermoanaerobaculia bacterium]